MEIDEHNMRVDLVDADTGKVIETMTFCDPYLGWVRAKDGSYYLSNGFGCGEPLEWWMKNNPRPR